LLHYFVLQYAVMAVMGFYLELMPAFIGRYLYFASRAATNTHN